MNYICIWLKKMIKIINSNLFKQIMKFGLIGGLAFLIDYSILYLLTDICHVYYLTSSVISFTVAFIFNYILSVKWVFNAKKQTLKEVIIFISLSLIGLLLNQIIMYVSVDIFNIYHMISKLFATAIVMIYNFITRKIFVEEKKQ